jgi:hypothetical protein
MLSRQKRDREDNPAESGFFRHRQCLCSGFGDSRIAGPSSERLADDQEKSALELATLRQQERLAILRKTIGSNWGPFEALGAMDTMRRLERVSYHTWRICNYLGREERPESALAEKQALLDA